MGIDNSRRYLCNLADVPDGGAKGFDLGRGAEPRDIFLVREEERLYGYVNSCPHLGTPLEMMPDAFVNDDGFILCATHGALFEVSDGRCFAGPCKGQSLEPLALEVTAAGEVYWRGGA